MTPSPLRSGARALRSLALCALMFTLAMPSCRRKPDAPAIAEQVAPGAAGWQQMSAELPAGSPMVLRLRPQALLDAGGDLFNWLTAEPAMFGPGEIGVERSAQIAAVRAEWGERLEGDPFEVETWRGQGIALDRPMFMSLYRLSPQGARFLEGVEAELLRRLDLPDVSLNEALRIRGDEIDQSGLYSAVSRLERQHRDTLGVRLVMGVRDEARLLALLDNAMMGADFARLARPDGEALRRVYFGAGEDQDVLVVSARALPGSTLALDLFYVPRFVTSEEQGRSEEIMALVTRVLEEQPAGLAAAPAPSDLSVASLGLSQEGMSRRLRELAYRRALTLAESEAASRRDERVYIALGLASLELDYWDTGARGVQGVNYELDVGGGYGAERRLFGVAMELFGEKGLSAPEVHQATRSLSVLAQGAGLSVDPAIFFSPSWREWLEPTTQDRVVDLIGELSFEGLGESFSQLFVGLALPRLLAQLLTTGEGELKNEAPLEFVPLYGQRDQIGRVEAILPGLDASNTWRDPNIVALITLDASLSTLQRDALTASLRDTLYYGSNFLEEEASGEESEQEEQEYRRARPLKAGAVLAFDVPASSELSRVYYYYERDGDSPYVIIARGSKASDNLEAILARGLSAPEDRGEAPSSFRLHIESSTLLQLSGGYDEGEDQLGPIDLPILTQRVGRDEFQHRARHAP